jgi:hypothetical protein
MYKKNSIVFTVLNLQIFFKSGKYSLVERKIKKNNEAHRSRTACEEEK